MKILITLLITLSAANAAIYGPKNSSSRDHKKIEEMVTNSIYEQLYKRSYKYRNLKAVKKKKPKKKKMTKGMSKIEQMKQRNRERLAIMRGVDPTKVKKGSDIVKLQKADNKEIVKKIHEKSSEWQNMAAAEIQELKRKVMVDHRAWRRKHLPTLKEWEEKREQFLKDIKKYKDTLVDIPEVNPVSKEEEKKEVGIEIDKEFRIVSEALSVPTKNQFTRPTCSAFAGIRSLEILMKQNRNKVDLSEHYFYWASKPNCRNRKCSEKGSWVGYGLDYSKNSATPDIPLEKNCPYQIASASGNETQVPLSNSCSSGKLKVTDYEYLKTLDEMIESLDNNKSVIVGMKLTPNFYRNEGLILYSERNKGNKMNSHAAGHTVIIVGYMKLPQVFDEGSVCFITTNSWGMGWGVGGHSCISEKWLLKQRNRNPFVAINRVKTK